MKIEFKLEVVIQWDDSESIALYGEAKTKQYNDRLTNELERIWLIEKAAFKTRLGNKIKNFMKGNQ